MDIVAELIKIAEDITADEDIFVVVDDKGANEVGESTFNGVFKASVKTAADGVPHISDKSLENSKTVIYVSPEVNATNKPAEGLAGLPRRLSNAIATMMNKIHARKFLDQAIVDMADDERKQHYTDEDVHTRTWPIGYTIQKASGHYNSTDADGKLHGYDEPSYQITFYGISESEADRIARFLRDKFRQESVLVDYGTTHSQFL